MSTDIFLGKTGLKVNRMGFGGIPIQRLSPGQSDLVIENALDSGIRFFDTARIYTDSESKLGRVLARRRKEAVIASKSFSRDGKGIARDLEASLRDLRTDYIDIYQFHNLASESDLEKVTEPSGALDVLVRAKEAGKIGHIGISGHKPWIVLKALEIYPFATIQVPFNYMETEASRELIPAAKRLQTGVIAMKPMGGGNIGAVEANFRFIFAQGIDVAIPGMDSTDQVLENISIATRLCPPDAVDIDRLEKEKERLGSDFCRRCEYCLPCPQGLPVAFLHVLKNYYFLYDLQDWVMERLDNLEKSFRDCTGCGECVKKCPYHLDSPGIFRRTWEAIRRDRGLG